MAAGVTIKMKRKAGAFTGGELAAGELGVDTSGADLYGSVDGSTVFLISDEGIASVVEDTTPQLGGELDAQNNKIVNLTDPTAAQDAATRAYVDAAINGLNWLEPVIDTQIDSSLDPGAGPATGDRYILEDVSALNANFGAISGVGDDDIVEYDGAAFIISFDASVEGEGFSSYDKAANFNKVFNGTAWVNFGGGTDHGSLTGLADDDHTQYSLITSQSGAPGTTPGRVGEVNVDITADEVYISVGTASSADWQRQVSFTATLDNSAMVIDGGTI